MNNFDFTGKLFKDSINLDAVLETIRDSNVRSYRNLYDIQKSIIGVQRLDIPLKDFDIIKRLPREKQNRMYPTRYEYSFGVDIVGGDREYRFKMSELKNVALTQYQISKNPNLFKSNFIAYLDGRVISTLQFLITETESRVIITINPTNEDLDYKEGIDRRYFEELLERNEILHLFVVPNYKMDYVDINRVVLNNVNGNIDRASFKDGGKFEEPASTFFFINTAMSNSHLDITDCELTDSTVNVRTEILNPDIRGFRLVAISFDMLYNIRSITQDSEWFMLEDEYELPLPITNIIPLVKTSTGHEFDPSITIDGYYPNIYHVNNVNGRRLSLLTFYADDTFDSKYVNDLQILYNAYDDVLERVKTKTFPEMVLNYQPFKMELFDKDDFASTIYFPSGQDLYNIDKFDEYVKDDPRLLIKYLYLKLRDTNKYYINANRLGEDRIRTDTKKDFDEIGEVMTFSEPHYLINLRKEFVGKFDMDFRLFIDNRHINGDQYIFTYNKDFYLFYIPVRLVNHDSVIEIEKYLQVRFIQDLNIEYMTDTNKTDELETIASVGGCEDTKTVPILIHLPETVDQLDSYGINIVDNDNFHMYVDSVCKLVIYNDLLERYIEISINGHYNIDRDFYLVFNPEYVGRNFSLVVDNSCLFIDIPLVHSANTHMVSFCPGGRINIINTRLFKNGLSVPELRYYVDTNKAPGTTAHALISTECGDEDDIKLDVLPVEFVEEFYLEEITNEKGFVDTGNSLSSPLDLNWYDIYVNGYKLNNTNVDIISSNKFFVQGVDSRKNLSIIKRNAIYDAFSTNYDNDLNNKLLDGVDDLFDKLCEDEDIISDTAENIISGIIEEVFNQILFVIKYLEFSHINPNIKQIPEIVKQQFPELFNEHDIMVLVTDDFDATTVTSINSNIRRQYMKNNKYRYSFTPLYVGNHHDALNCEYMCDPITGSPAMKTDKGEIIVTGLLNRLAMHRDRVNTALALNNMTAVSIYHLELDDNTGSTELTPGVNMMDDVVDFDEPIDEALLSIDMDVLDKGHDDVMLFSSYQPIINIEYQKENDGEIFTITRPLSVISEVPIKLDGPNVTITSISIQPDENIPETIKFILYSILIAF